MSWPSSGVHLFTTSNINPAGKSLKVAHMGEHTCHGSDGNCLMMKLLRCSFSTLVRTARS